MKFEFSYKKKNFHLEVKECKSISAKARGLMFKKKSKPLLFIFKKLNRQPIHSFFCKPFIIIWFRENKIIDTKVIKKWKFSIKPKEKFDKILEIPSNNANFKKFIDERKI